MLNKYDLSSIDDAITKAQNHLNELLKIKKQLQKETQEKIVNLNEEIWRPIQDCPGYEVSSFGKIKSNKTNRIMSQYKKNTGYMQCTVYNSNQGRVSFLVHRLVAQAFLLDWDPELSVDHLDHNPENNRLDNLAMATFKANFKRKSSIKPVNQYDLSGNFLRQFQSCDEAAATLNCNAHNIKNCARGHQLTSTGYKWEFAEGEI